MLGNPSLHRRSHTQGLMNSAKIVVGKMQSNGRFVIVELLGSVPGCVTVFSESLLDVYFQ